MTSTDVRVAEALASYGYCDALHNPILAISAMLHITLEDAKGYAWDLEKRGLVARRYRVQDGSEPTDMRSRWLLRKQL
jgi:hypothetical protein